MSVFSGEITKHMRSASACSMRSIRNSLTALGRSTPCSSRTLPTGSISFENASGCRRLAAPAAGTMPSTRPSHAASKSRIRAAPVCSARSARARRADAAQLRLSRARARLYVVGRCPRRGFRSRREELVHPWPAIGQDWRARTLAASNTRPDGEYPHCSIAWRVTFSVSRWPSRTSDARLAQDARAVRRSPASAGARVQRADDEKPPRVGARGLEQQALEAAWRSAAYVPR